jgi:ATP-dependent helicase/nuclease subunit A
MVREHLLSENERAALDLDAIASFWSSKIGREILAQSGCLHRELPFTARLSLTELETFQTQELAALVNDLGRNPSRGAAARRAKTRNAPEQASLPFVDVSPSAAVAEHEFVVISGVVDLVVLLPAEIWLLDFKTDAGDEDDWKEKAKLYAPQMKLYAVALQRIFQRPVTRAWLHSIPLRRTLQCEA